jgi:xanthine dehydrogenase accessory factor
MDEDEPIALATVIQTWGSSPRRVGAKMAMTKSGRITGSVSGGCVEGAVVHAGIEVLENGQPQLLHFGVADETAWQVGLACGGTIEVFVQPFESGAFDTLRDSLSLGIPLVTATVVQGPDEFLGSGIIYAKTGQDLDQTPVAGKVDGQLEALMAASAREALVEKSSQRRELDLEDKNEHLEIFLEVSLPPPTLVIVGGVHIAIALTSIAHTLGYRTVIIDPRGAFGSPDRFAHGDKLIQAWPEKALAQVDLNDDTAVTMLTHDPKIDDPALKIVLNSPAFYVGALGSRTTQEKRRKRLLKAGLSEEQLARLAAPIGLDIGAQTPEEIALAIMAEIVAARHQRTTGR